MFENPRRGRQARNLTTNAPKILDLKSSSEQIFSGKLPLGHPLIKRSVFKVPKISCYFDLYKWSPLLSGRGHHLRSPNGTFSIVVTFILKTVTRCQVPVHTVSNIVTLEV